MTVYPDNPAKDFNEWIGYIHNQLKPKTNATDKVHILKSSSSYSAFYNDRYRPFNNPSLLKKVIANEEKYEGVGI